MLFSSFSTDDDNDTEVEAIEVDTELNLVTECWVEPQSGHIRSTAENWRYLQGLPYQKIPKAVSLQGRVGMVSPVTCQAPIGPGPMQIQTKIF